MSKNGDAPHEESIAHKALNHSLSLHESLGALAAEVSSLRTEMVEGFKRLGVNVRRTRRELESLSDEVEDTKTHDLRKELGRYRRRSRWFLGLVSALVVAVAAGIVERFVLHH
ncbi:MAG: hypothetical protein ACHQC8_07690 [Solirubrobacterales bacterium]